MERLISITRYLIQIVIVGVILVQTKRKAKWLFWPLFVLTNLLLSPWIVIAIISVLIIFIDFFLGLSVEIRDIEWLIWLLWITIFLILIPTLYKAINLLEEAIHGSITEISSTGKLLGYCWGIIATLFTLYRLDFFSYL
jgi:small-conductance mechanosensitive channel